MTLVNVNPIETRDVIVQTGAYAEHQATQYNDSQFTIRLAPGAGDTLTIAMKRYANAPTAAFPWDRQ